MFPKRLDIIVFDDKNPIAECKITKIRNRFINIGKRSGYNFNIPKNCIKCINNIEYIDTKSIIRIRKVTRRYNIFPLNVVSKRKYITNYRAVYPLSRIAWRM